MLKFHISQLEFVLQIMKLLLSIFTQLDLGVVSVDQVLVSRVKVNQLLFFGLDVVHEDREFDVLLLDLLFFALKHFAHLVELLASEIKLVLLKGKSLLLLFKFQFHFGFTADHGLKAALVVLLQHGDHLGLRLSFCIQLEFLGVEAIKDFGSSSHLQITLHLLSFCASFWDN